MELIPAYVHIVFASSTLLTLVFLVLASNQSRWVWIFSASLLTIQGAIAATGFFTQTDTLPPRPFFLLLPSLLLIVLLFSTQKGRVWLDQLNPKWLTWLHVVRIPVELVLFWLCAAKVVSPLMTFEGINYDIFSGITAIAVAYFGYHKKKLNTTILLLWNFICLGLLINIVVVAVLSLPSPFQQLSFTQPNIAVLYFPFVWLPGFIVPAVLLSHLVCIRSLVRVKSKDKR